MKILSAEIFLGGAYCEAWPDSCLRNLHAFVICMSWVCLKMMIYHSIFFAKCPTKLNHMYAKPKSMNKKRWLQFKLFIGFLHFGKHNHTPSIMIMIMNHWVYGHLALPEEMCVYITILFFPLFFIFLNSLSFIVTFIINMQSNICRDLTWIRVNWIMMGGITTYNTKLISTAPNFFNFNSFW